MNITINIPGLDALAAAINNLASAYGDGTDARPTRAAVPNKEKLVETVAATRERLVQEDKAAAAKGKVVEKETEVGTAAEGKPVSLTADDVKKMAAKLTMTEGGNDKLKALFEQFGAKKFSEVPAEKLGEFAQALVKAGVPLPTAA